ncbi:MAG: hypothetical protein ACLPHP_07640 [Candidatus Sulfotelmatobacter sp.]
MAEQSYGTWKDWLLCFAAAIFMHTPSWHSSRWHKNHPNTQPPTINPTLTKDPQNGKSLPHRVLDVIEQPLFTTPFGIVGGIVGTFFYTPICLVCDTCVLLALHRSKAVADKNKKTQVFIYALLFLATTAVLIGVSHYVQKAARAYVTDLVNQIIAGVRSDTRPSAYPIPGQPLSQKRCDDVISQGQIFIYPPPPNETKKSPNYELSECRLRYRPDQLTLFDLFNTDFSEPPYTYTSSYAMKIRTGGSVKTESLVDYAVVAQLSSANRFLSFYIWPTSEVFDVSIELSNKYQIALNDPWANIKVTGKAATGDSEAASSEDAVFSKRVFIYYENYLTLEQLLNIQNAFKKQGLSVILRGSDYLENEKLRAKLATKN